MAGDKSKWLLGCGVGCGALLVLIVILGVAGYVAIKSRMQGFQAAEKAGNELERRYGRIDQYCPPPSGEVAPDRIRLFLDLRDKLAPERRAMEKAFADLSSGIHDAKEGHDSFPQVLGLIRRGFGMLPQLGRFQEARATSLLDAGMSPGEYLHIYVLAYYSLLGKSPGDGPEFDIHMEAGTPRAERRERGHRREGRHDLATAHTRRLYLAMLRNQLAKLDEGRAEAAPDRWRDALRAEIEALEAGRTRIPWQDGLPKQIENSLLPFKSRLEASYSSMLNPLEVQMWSDDFHKP
jgi:hypothetical protein